MRKIAFLLLMMTTLSGTVLAADKEPKSSANVDTSGTSSSNVKLSEMPVEPFSVPLATMDADNDGIPDSKDKDIAIPNPFAPQIVKEDEPKKKQVYVATPTIELRRPIQDKRIDDGYVQGLIQHRANAATIITTK